ncbi:MAG: hypothetical protein ABJC79_11615 [Acidimicrobiia bacterium]
MAALYRTIRAFWIAIFAAAPVACAPIYTATCQNRLVTSSAGPVTDPALNEISGIHAGVRNPGIWWVHNDSGDTARVFALDATGAVRGTYSFPGTTAVDWEDIAVVPGPTTGAGAIYAADIGDNPKNRTEVQLYRVVEPDVALTGPAAVDTLPAVDTLHLTYPDGPHDAEALVVDPVFGDAVIIAKSITGGTVNVYQAPADLVAGSTTALLKVGQLALGAGFTNAVTAADVTLDGKAVAIRTYGKVLVFNRDPEKKVWTALAGSPCAAPLPAEGQGEAVGFRSDGRQLATVSEGLNQTLHFSTLP